MKHIGKLEEELRKLILMKKEMRGQQEQEKADGQ